MNCQDLALVFDDGDINRLADGQRQEAEAHLAGCAVCRMEQQVQLRLASVAVPALPPGLAAQCLKRVDAVPFSAGLRRNSRRILVGVSLAIAAAAAVVVVQVTSPPPIPADTAAVAHSGESTAVADVQSSPAVSNSSAREVGGSVTPPAKPKSEPVAAVAVVPVRLMPLDSKGLDATSVLILDQFHATFARGLTAIPGVSMLSTNEPDPAGLYVQISMKIAGVRADGARSISVTTARMRGGQADTVLFGPDALVAPGADLTQPVDKALSGLRTLVKLPGDPAVRNELNYRMLDPATDRAAKQIAMSKLLAPSLKTADPAGRKVLYTAALDLLAGGDPVAGDAIWSLLTGTSPELMDAATDALPAIKDVDVRRKLLTILSNGIRNLDNPGMSAGMRAQSPETMARMDAIAPKVRAQLESIAESDPNRLNRMVATRALSGDAEWNEFVVASLKNTTLADAERLEGFAYLGGAGAPVIVIVTNPLLDDAAIRSAEELIVRMGRDPAQERQVLNAVKVLAAVRGEGARDAAITVLRPGSGLSAASPVRAAMLVPLMINKGADPAVRQAVEELASNDPDPLMRRRAGQVLQVTDQLAKDRMPLVLLQSSALIESVTPVR